MNKRFLAAVAALSLIALVGCGGEEAAVEQNAAADAHAGHDHAGHDHADHAGHAHADAHAAPAGEVLETFDGGGYTYVRVATADGEVWAAGPQTAMEVGRQVTLDGGMVMTNFKSSSLDRTFDEILFVGSFGADEEAAIRDEMQRAHGNVSQGDPSVDTSGVAKAQGGYTVAEVHGLDASHAGDRVIVRGKVVKALSGIMGHNWLHLQDGSGDAGAGTHDLTVTTDASAKVGDTVVIDGLLAVNKDFGSGYFYKVIVEEAAVTVE